MADETAYSYEPALGHGLRHDPFNAIVAPRPIGWISTVSAEGVLNLAPYSFFNAFNYRPPLVGFASIGRKDTLRNAEATGAFCWNLATRALAERMNLTSAPAPATVDEFELVGLTPAPGVRVGAPRVLESPVNFECRVTQLLELKGAEGAGVDTWMVFGEVVMVHIDQGLLIDDGGYDTAAARPIVRAGRSGDYYEIGPDAFFQMRRPDWPIGP
ncbi:flavin reductase family protein [Phenylobacterium sp.]|uniref:flavin reductase family protein n=1 Tax=Phenylobacterium sp. TaxID=1871053 RepID=UPI002E2EE062|nr:flavin reductase family protein [Phenylobacterium sp.]HEX2559869.1 flavin reductase family protein [Phenylobacterium sp.]